MATVTLADVTEPAEASSTEDADDAAIRAALLRSDARLAVARCARAHGPSLTRFCAVLLASASEADEAVQETLLAAFDGANGFRGDAPVRGWLFGIARRICARRLEVRTRQARRRTLLIEGERARGADDALDDARRTHAIRGLLEELRPTEREALLLRFEGDLSYREIATATGVDEPAARQRVSRALARMRTRLAELEAEGRR